MKVNPVGGYYLVKPLPPEAQSQGGILLPDASKRNRNMGYVVAKGPGWWRDSSQSRTPMPAEPGDVVLYSSTRGTDVEHEGERHVMVDSALVLAIVEGLEL